MGNVLIVVMGRALALIAMVFALVGIAVSMSSYAQNEFSLSTADISTHTKAFCSPKDGLLHCEDRLVVESETTEHVADFSMVTGSAFIDTL